MVVNIFNRISGFQQSYNVSTTADQRTSKTLISMRSSVPLLFTFLLKSCQLQVYTTWMDFSRVNMIIFSRKKRRDLSSLPLVKNVDCGYMLVSHEQGGSNGYPQSMPLYKTSKHRLREHFKTPRRSSHNRCFSIKMKSIHVDLLSTPVSLQYKSRGGVSGGGSKLHGYFFQADFIHFIQLFLFVFVLY